LKEFQVVSWRTSLLSVVCEQTGAVAVAELEEGGESVARRLADQDRRLDAVIEWGEALEGKLGAG